MNRLQTCRRIHGSLRRLYRRAPLWAKPAIFRACCVVFAVGMSGCTSFGPPDVSQIAANNKNAAVVCTTYVGAGGTFKVVVVNQEAGVIKDGGITVNADCLVQTQSVAPPRAPVQPKEPAK